MATPLQHFRVILPPVDQWTKSQQLCDYAQCCKVDKSGIHNAKGQTGHYIGWLYILKGSWNVASFQINADQLQ